MAQAAALDTVVTEEGDEVEVLAAGQEEADLAAGFNVVHSLKGSPAASTAAETANNQAANNQADTTAAAVTDVKKATPPAPPARIADMTREELQAEIMKNNTTIEERVAAEIRKVQSKYGEANRTIQELKTAIAAAPKGSRKKITADALARVNAELPGLGDALAQDLGALFDELPEAAAAAAARGEAFDPDKYFNDKIVPALRDMETRNKADLPRLIEEARQKARLDVAHEGWEDTVKTPEFTAYAYANGPTEAERQRLAQLEKTDPAAADRELTAHIKKYPQWWADTGSLVMSDKAGDAIKILTGFKAAAGKPQPRARDNKARLEQAITPKTGGATPLPETNDEEADLAKGFNRAKGK